MHAFTQHFDPDSVNWHHVTSDDFEGYNLDYEYSLLGYDLAAGKLDIVRGDVVDQPSAENRIQRSHIVDGRPESVRRRIFTRRGFNSRHAKHG